MGFSLIPPHDSSLSNSPQDLPLCLRFYSSAYCNILQSVTNHLFSFDLILLCTPLVIFRGSYFCITKEANFCTVSNPWILANNFYQKNLSCNTILHVFIRWKILLLLNLNIHDHSTGKVKFKKNFKYHLNFSQDSNKKF